MKEKMCITIDRELARRIKADNENFSAAIEQIIQEYFKKDPAVRLQYLEAQRADLELEINRVRLEAAKIEAAKKAAIEAHNREVIKECPPQPAIIDSANELKARAIATLKERYHGRGDQILREKYSLWKKRDFQGACP